MCVLVFVGALGFLLLVCGFGWVWGGFCLLVCFLLEAFGVYSYLMGNKHVSNILTSIAPRRLALSPMLSSMYLLSSSVIVGCFAGLS